MSLDGECLVHTEDLEEERQLLSKLFYHREAQNPWLPSDVLTQHLTRTYKH